MQTVGEAMVYEASIVKDPFSIPSPATLNPTLFTAFLWSSQVQKPQSPSFSLASNSCFKHHFSRLWDQDEIKLQWAPLMGFLLLHTTILFKTPLNLRCILPYSLYNLSMSEDSIPWRDSSQTWSMSMICKKSPSVMKSRSPSFVRLEPKIEMVLYRSLHSPFTCKHIRVHQC